MKMPITWKISFSAFFTQHLKKPVIDLMVMTLTNSINLKFKD